MTSSTRPLSWTSTPTGPGRLQQDGEPFAAFSIDFDTDAADAQALLDSVSRAMSHNAC
jgi:hypothetical protein